MGRITVYLNDEIEGEIEQESKNKGISKSKLLRKSLEEHYQFKELKNEVENIKKENRALKNKINNLENKKETLEAKIESKNSTIQSKEETINTLKTQLSLANSRNIDNLKEKANPLSRFFLAMALGFSGVGVEDGVEEEND